MIKMKLHTDDLPLILNRTFYDDMLENFKLLEQCFHVLDENLDQEIADRKAAVAKERNDRIAADDTERRERKDADEHLQGQIDGLRTRLTTAEGNIKDLQTRTSSLEEQVKKLNEIIFGTQYINDTDDIPIDDSMTPGNDEEINDTETVNDDEAEVRTPDHDVLADEVN